MKYSKQIISDVLAANDIVDVIGATVELKAAGSARFKACCPFHNEKTPSFMVSRDRQHYHCFGCGKHGTALNFLCEHDGLSFLEALRKLADRAGIRLPAASEADSQEDFLRSQMKEFSSFAAKFFRELLDDKLRGGICREYLKKRALKPETLREFGIGYAPDDFSLIDKAKDAGFRETVMEASGIVRRGDRGGLYSLFRNRLMVPIRHTTGDVVAFGGRALGDATPKYINSPENVLYKKSRVLYGLCEAREAFRREKYAILVEGYFDLLRCFDAGFRNVVAPCGTALTPEQAALIKRYVPEVIVIFDADEAGIRAAIRGIGILTNAGLTVKALVVPDGKDPDDFIKANGAEAFRNLIDNARDFISFYVNMSAARIKTIEGRTAVAREIFEILVSLDDEMQRDAYLTLAAKLLRLDKYACAEEYRKYVIERANKTALKAEPSTTKPVFNQDDLDFIAALLSNEVLLRQVKTGLKDVEPGPGPLFEILAVLFDADKTDPGLRLETEAANALYAAAANVPELSAEKYSEIVEKRLVRIKRDALVARELRINEDLQAAVDAHNEARALELLKEKNAIRRQIEEIGAA